MVIIWQQRLDSDFGRYYVAAEFRGLKARCLERELAVSENDRDGRQGPVDPQTGDLSERLRRVDAALDRARSEKRAEEKKGSRSVNDNRGFAVALRLSSEFIAGVIVGGGLGWLIDSSFDTSPWGLIVCFLLGFVAGVLNVMRSVGLAGKGLGGTAVKGDVPPDNKGE